MGRSLGPIAVARSTGVEIGSRRHRFEARGLVYAVEQDGERVIHREVRQDATRRIIAQN
jgi:hypothetical protein